MPAAESALSLVIAAAFGMFAAAAAAVLPPPDPAAALSVLDDARMRLVCVSGSLGGAVISVMLFRIFHVRELAAKLTCSSLSGILFSPMALRWLGWQRDLDAILATSALTALLSWSILQAAVPLLTRIATKRLTDQISTKEV